MALKKLFVIFSILVLASFGGRAQGIDVSKYQGKINWAKVAKNGKTKFVYIKATEGTSIKDPQYKSNLEGARKAGLKVGSYHLYSSKTSAYDQFANFKSVVPKKKQDLIPVLDIEGHHSGRLYMARVDKLLELMEREYGVRPIIYTSEALYVRHFSGAKYKKYKFFIANYKRKPSVPYTLWQHTEKGSVAGISGYVDLDKFHPKSGMNDILLPSKRKKSAEADAKVETKTTPAADTTAKAKDTISK